MTNDEHSFLLDLKHGIVLFSGSRLEMDERRKSFLDRCKPFQIEEEVAAALRIVAASTLNKDEIVYMNEKQRIPRRVEMRLKPKVAE
jgi:hypothetical protein